MPKIEIDLPDDFTKEVVREQIVWHDNIVCMHTANLYRVIYSDSLMLKSYYSFQMKAFPK